MEGITAGITQRIPIIITRGIITTHIGLADGTDHIGEGTTAVIGMAAVAIRAAGVADGTAVMGTANCC
jgi:hypothetical protein